MSKSNSRTRVLEQSVGSVGSYMRKRMVRDCRCGVECVIRTVTDVTNPNYGKHFWGCSNYRNSLDKGCSFFRLVDEEVVDDRDLKIEKQKKKNRQLKNELANSLKWLKISSIFALICFGICLVLGTMLLCNGSGKWSQMYLK